MGTARIVCCAALLQACAVSQERVCEAGAACQDPSGPVSLLQWQGDDNRGNLEPVSIKEQSNFVVESSGTCDAQLANFACAGGQCYTCGARIQWMMTAQGGLMTELQARMIVGNEFPVQCGDCSQFICDQWNDLACEVSTSECHTCGARIKWLMSEQGGSLSEWKARERVGNEFPAECDECASVDKPATQPKETCDQQWDAFACEQMPGKQEECYTCGARIKYLMSADGGSLSEAVAKDTVATEFIAECGACGSDDDNVVLGTEDYQEVWRDDFNGSGPVDVSKWTHEDAGHGFGNQELQYYTPRDKNSYQSGGSLFIRASREDYNGRLYTSAKLMSKEAWRYAKISVRTRLNQAVARGTWVAHWMLPRNFTVWPDDGEIDIMEHVGYDSGRVYGTVHTECCYHATNTQVVGSERADLRNWHVYTLEWLPDIIKFALDGKVYQVYPNKHTNRQQWPFDEPFYVILNMAVGGHWGGAFGVDETAFKGDGQIMEVDWVKVEQKL